MQGGGEDTNDVFTAVSGHHGEGVVQEAKLQNWTAPDAVRKV
jgi:hypothetical protein